MSAAALHSAVYRGWMRHRRYYPVPHAFRHPIFLLYLDLDELDRVFQGRWFWSHERFNLACFRRRDYLGPIDLPLAEAVRQRFRAAGLTVPDGPIRLLTHVRYFGHCFNPVSFYYCYDRSGGELAAILAEITNTPWGERHAYLLPASAATRHGRAWHFGFEKSFHVSPFLPMERRYLWRFTAPAETLHVHMDVMDGSRRQFDASLVLERRHPTGRELAYCLMRYPAMTVQVLVSIYWNALCIKLKGNPFFEHPQAHRKPAP